MTTKDATTWTAPVEFDQPVPRRVISSNCRTSNRVILHGLCLLVSFGLLGATAIFKWNEAALLPRGLSVIGRVTEPLPHYQRRANFLSVSYEYKTMDGRVFTSSDVVGQFYYDTLSVGSSITIVYDPDDPSRSAIRYAGMSNTFVPSHSFAFTGSIAGILFVLELVFECLGSRNFQVEKRILSNGQPEEPLIVGTRFWSIRGQSWCSIRFRLRSDPIGAPDRKGSVPEAAAKQFLSNPVAVVERTGKPICMLYCPEQNQAALET